MYRLIDRFTCFFLYNIIMEIKCEFCNEIINSRGIASHLLKKHNKTVKDNTLARLGKTKSDIPSCRFCGKPVVVTVKGFSDICLSKDCKDKLTHLHKSEAVSRQQHDLAKAGKHRFQRKNLARDENGKSVKHIQLAINQVKRGIHPFQKQNRPKTETGKDLYVHNANILRALGHAKNTELFTKEYLEANFVKNGRFLIGECMRFFNYSYPMVNRFKARAGILVPNKHENLGAQQLQISNFIRSIYSGDIIENSHDVIPPYEIDIYLPEKKIAIEFDGLMYHSMGLQFPAQTDDRLVNYHLLKTELCEKEGIHLLHIFENEWIDKPDIWKSVISNKLGLSASRINARDCDVREIPAPYNFFSVNHLQGTMPSAKVSVGLFFDEELVSAMSFGKPRYSDVADWELLRFCNKLGCSVPGAASKMLKHFRKNHAGTIVSYANRRWSGGSLYEKLGFVRISVSDPGYYYFLPKDFVLHHRSQFQKHKLPGLLQNFDKSLSETENMFNNGYRKIYDCGSLTYYLK